MSEQLEPKIEEVERKRQELAETIRRVGDALATGLDRRGVVALTVRQAVDACDVGPELIGALEGDERAERTRRAVSAHGPGVHALSIGLRSLVDGPEYLGAISIARRGKPFTRDEEELLEYLAGGRVGREREPARGGAAPGGHRRADGAREPSPPSSTRSIASWSEAAASARRWGS